MVALGAAAILAISVAGVARAVSGGGVATHVEFSTGANVSTPSGTFITVATKTFTANPGPLVIRFNASGWVKDYGSGGSFVGTSYAAMKVRVLLGSTPVSPGAVTFFDNTGKIGVAISRPMANSFEWAGTIGTGGAKTVKVQVSNLHAFDNAQINSWTLAIQHA